ncbi:MAG: amidohydrolase family protein [Planctomycetota bacterium]
MAQSKSHRGGSDLPARDFGARSPAGPLEVEAERTVLSPDLSLERSVVRVDGGRIVEIASLEGRRDVGVASRTRGADSPRARLVLTSGVLIPGLVNAHAHLDLTALAGRIDGSRGFLPWVRGLVALRSRLDGNEQREAVRAGIEASIRSGTTSIGDIDSFGVSWREIARGGLRGVAYRELLGFSPAAIEAARVAAAAWLEQPLPAPSRLAKGFSPHAPYSTSIELYALACQVGRSPETALCTHAAETREERTFLERGEGEMAELLRALSPTGDRLPFPRQGPVQFLAESRFLGPTRALVHANYLSPDEMDLIATARSPVIYCPRSHLFFGHERHPVAELLARGVTVALGTDSLASNTTLGILDEMAAVRQLRRDLEPGAVLAMATTGGARALGLRHTGVLAPGAHADLVGLSGPTPLPRAHEELLDWVMSGEVTVVLCMVGGEVLAQAGATRVVVEGDSGSVPGAREALRLS